MTEDTQQAQMILVKVARCNAIKRQLESTTDMMMELADRLGELPDDVDPRAWEHLLVYAPQRTWVELSDEEAQWLYDNCRTPSNLIDMTEAKLKDKNT